MSEKKTEMCLHCGKTLEEHFGYSYRCESTFLLLWTPDDRPALRERIAEMKAALSGFRRSFAGHVYVKNEDYGALCRKRDRSDALEKALREIEDAGADSYEGLREIARAALAGEKASTINVMGSPVVVDPSVPPGEVHIKNIGPSATLAGEKAVCPICDGGPGNDCACTCPKESAAPALAGEKP